MKYPREAYFCNYELADGSEIFFSPACGSCLWYEQVLEEHCCRAFPDGIPPDIWRGARSHRNPIEGDNGFYYVFIDDDEEIMRRFEEIPEQRSPFPIV